MKGELTESHWSGLIALGLAAATCLLAISPW